MTAAPGTCSSLGRRTVPCRVDHGVVGGLRVTDPAVQVEVVAQVGAEDHAAGVGLKALGRIDAADLIDAYKWSLVHRARI